MVIWAFVIVVVALIVLDIPSKLRKIRGPPRTPQTTFGAKRDNELRAEQEDVRKRQFEHFSRKLEEEAAKRAEEDKKKAEERAKRLQEQGDDCYSKSSAGAMPSRSYGDDRSFSHMSSSSGHRSVVRRVQPRQNS
jgi:predicted Holliday junction resolvase-like endonuclease